MLLITRYCSQQYVVTKQHNAPFPQSVMLWVSSAVHAGIHAKEPQPSAVSYCSTCTECEIMVFIILTP